MSRISRYANTQNKVNDADFTANNAHLVAFEKLSRYILTPITEDSNIQTYWFFERARGQYKNFRQKEGFTKSRQAAFDLKYPKKQVITKVELAKYINAYEEVYDGKKLLSDRLLLYVVTKRTTASSLITTYLKILKTSIVYIMKMPLQKRYYSELPIKDMEPRYQEIILVS